MILIDEAEVRYRIACAQNVRGGRLRARSIFHQLEAPRFGGIEFQTFERANLYAFDERSVVIDN